ncbi:MAG: acetyl-CoA C-acetyltransferase [Anaerolineales bacterium]|jgi:acetyl-CoA C-acetyltransferase
MSEDHDPVILSACRTAIGKFGGSLSSLPAPALGAAAIREAVRRSAVDPEQIEEVLMGNVVSAGIGQAPARQASVQAGLPVHVGATALNKVCGSGLKAVMVAASMIRAGDADLIVAGGMENMDLAPYLLSQARGGYRLGDGILVDGLIHDGLWCAFQHTHMGNSAEWIARKFELRREELDAFALESHRKALAAIDQGQFRSEIVAVEVPQSRGTALRFEVDEAPRRDTSLEALARLKPAFEKDGVVTAGNSPGITDGAAALVISSAARAQAEGLHPLARISSYAQAAVPPLELFTAPIFAIRKLLKKEGRKLADYDRIEINEAFASQVLADGKGLETEGWDWGRVNVHGGAIALGHPIGASGARILVTLIYALQQSRGRRGLASLCLGGGEAVALAIELL